MDGLGDWPVFDEQAAWDGAQQALIAAELSDGLPLVVPTAERLSKMLDGVADSGIAHRPMPPLFNELTPVAVAYNCVIAGCAPGAVPVVTAAATACLEPEFNLLGLATTTGSPAVAMVVHGAIGEQLGMNAGVNCLAPGNRANATLGRAMALVLRNVAGMCTGAGDMATMGQPGKYGFCFAESADKTFQPFHVRRGLDAGDSAVTVLGVSGTAEVLPSVETGNWDDPEAILNPVALMMRAVLIAGGGARKPEGGEQVLLLPPELAGLIAERGWTIGRIQEFLCNAGQVAGQSDDVHVMVTGGPGNKMTVLPVWGGGTRCVTRRVSA